jgi:hypothetical protein
MTATFNPELLTQTDHIRLALGDKNCAYTAAVVAIAAHAALTVSGVGTEGDIVTIDTTVYTLKDALTSPAVPYEVLIGATADETAANLVAAIMDAAGEGVTFGTGTAAHPSVTAVAADGVITATAKVAGTDGNLIAVSKQGAALAWSSGLLVLGAEATTTPATSANVVDPLLSDETIAAKLAAFSYSEALAQLAEALVAEYGQLPDKLTDDTLGMEWNGRLAVWREIAIKARAGLIVTAATRHTPRPGVAVQLLTAPVEGDFRSD